jgi:hypothetical protein
MLGENISRLFCAREVSVFSWKSSKVPDYRVEADVLYLDGYMSEAVGLEA